eukprot:TRINITY_DN13012_c0_g1_i1.p1 TRINITY_DN13012_c0_g1~~TRINITY_DN13012_c0_g1_i1.p1  ORF type:complete len:109 (-),score=17.43 TRINITY_DN13012_c0_g1_i1:65-391(-)
MFVIVVLFNLLSLQFVWIWRCCCVHHHVYCIAHYLRSTSIVTGFSRYCLKRLLNRTMVAPSTTLWSALHETCLLYTSDAADEEDSVDLGGRRIIKKKKKRNTYNTRDD